MENKVDLDKYRGYDSIYFFAVDERKPELLKVGKTKDIVLRLRNYNVGRIKESRIKVLCISKKLIVN